MENIKPLFKKYKFIILLIVIIVIGVGITVFFLTRPPRITIQNYNELSSAPSSTKARLEEFLYRFLDSRHDNIKDLNDVYIRDSSYQKETDNDLTSEIFLIDIDSLQITYQISYTWSNKDIVTDGVIIDCPKTKDTKYPESKCLGMYNSSEEMATREKYPLIDILPLEINEYTNNYSEHLNYRLTYNINSDNSVTITITDISGGNYNNAIKKISNLGYNPNDYKFEYKDESSQNYWPRITKY